MLLRTAQTVLRPSLIRTFNTPASVSSLHTLPDLPYAYDVR